jgi:hypothetical protein
VRSFIVRETGFLASAFLRLLHASPSAGGALDRKNAVLLTAQAMVIHEKFLKLSLESLAKIVDTLYVSIAMVVVFDRDHAIVAFGFLLIALLPFNHTDNSARQLAPRKCRLVHQHQHIDRIAIATLGGGHKPEVVREGHPSRQHFLQGKDSLLRIVCVFIPASLRCLDDHRKKAGTILVGSPQLCGLGKSRSAFL